MALSQDLYHVDLTFSCPACAHPIVKQGKWFAATKQVTCPACDVRTLLGYPDKVALFARHNIP